MEKAVLTGTPAERRRLEHEAKFGAASWSAARVHTRKTQQLYNRARHWIGLLTGVDAAGYAQYWVNGTIPAVRGRPPRESRTFCPGKLGASSAFDSAGYCDAFWPASAGELCSAFVIGVGGHWAFARYATSMGCSVHAYDPTLELRRSHEQGASRLRDVHFHFAGLGGGGGVPSELAPTRSSLNSYGTIHRAQLMTLDEMVASKPASSGALRVLTIDCEGCEWSAIEQLALNESNALQHVHLLMLE
eukprot:5331740-Prymnesium_polylepis.1